MAEPQRKGSQPRSAGHESIDGTMSGSALKFDLASELDELHRDEAWLHPTGRSSKTLVKYPDLRIVLINGEGTTGDGRRSGPHARKSTSLAEGPS